jgi:hypothetical protein
VRLPLPVRRRRPRQAFSGPSCVRRAASTRPPSRRPAPSA